VFKTIVSRNDPRHETQRREHYTTMTLIAPSINELQRLYQNCEKELEWLDMRINVKKSCCLRINPRCNATYTSTITSDGHNLPWVGEMRYLGVYCVTRRTMRCSVVYAKRSF